MIPSDRSFRRGGSGRSTSLRNTPTIPLYDGYDPADVATCGPGAPNGGGTDPNAGPGCGGGGTDGGPGGGGPEPRLRRCGPAPGTRPPPRAPRGAARGPRA